MIQVPSLFSMFMSSPLQGANYAAHCSGKRRLETLCYMPIASTPPKLKIPYHLDNTFAYVEIDNFFKEEAGKLQDRLLERGYSRSCQARLSIKWLLSPTTISFSNPR